MTTAQRNMTPDPHVETIGQREAIYTVKGKRNKKKFRKFQVDSSMRSTCDIAGYAIRIYSGQVSFSFCVILFFISSPAISVSLRFYYRHCLLESFGRLFSATPYAQSAMR